LFGYPRKKEQQAQLLTDAAKVESRSTPSLRLAFGLMSAGALELGRRMVRARFLGWRRKDPAELERLRRLDVNKRGRISAGRIVDLAEAETAGLKSSLIVYSYEVAGVNYEAAQDVTPLPEIAAIAQFLPGRTASVKYDPKRPANSIIACEEWSGLARETGGQGKTVGSKQ
jgi:hypothetical protein